MGAHDRSEELLTVQEVAALLKLNPQTVRNRIDAGELPAVRLGRRVRVQRSALEDLLGWHYTERDSHGGPAGPTAGRTVQGLDSVADALDHIAVGFHMLAVAVRTSEGPLADKPAEG